MLINCAATLLRLFYSISSLGVVSLSLRLRVPALPMSEHITERHLVPIFDGSNFQQWRQRIANLLIEKDLDDITGFSLKTLLPLDAQPSLHDKTKVDRKARAAIQHRVNDTVLTIIEGCSTAYATWKLLHNTYQRKSTAATV